MAGGLQAFLEERHAAHDHRHRAAGGALDGGFDPHGDHLLLAWRRPDHPRVRRPPRLRHDTGRGPLRRRPLRPHKPPRRRALRGPRPQGEVIKMAETQAQQDVAADTG